MGLFQWLKNIEAGARQPAIQVPDGPPTPRVRRFYRFSGVVQGVGFRYEARTLAVQLKLAGCVRNNSDGSVSMEVEGEAARIDELLRAIQAVPRFRITGIQVEDLPVSGTETAFKMLY